MVQVCRTSPALFIYSAFADKSPCPLSSTKTNVALPLVGVAMRVIAEPPLPTLILPKLSRKLVRDALTSTMPKGISVNVQIPDVSVVQ